MEYYPWWNEAQKKLADEAKKVTDEILIPMGEKCVLKKEFPWEAVKEMAKRGWFGAQVPAKYGGHAEEWGVETLPSQPRLVANILIRKLPVLR